MFSFTSISRPRMQLQKRSDSVDVCGMARQGQNGKNLTCKWCIPLHLMKISCTEVQVLLKTELPAFGK